MAELFLYKWAPNPTDFWMTQSSVESLHKLWCTYDSNIEARTTNLYLWRPASQIKSHLSVWKVRQTCSFAHLTIFRNDGTWIETRSPIFKKKSSFHMHIDYFTARSTRLLFCKRRCTLRDSKLHHRKAPPHPSQKRLQRRCSRVPSTSSQHSLLLIPAEWWDSHLVTCILIYNSFQYNRC